MSDRQMAAQSSPISWALTLPAQHLQIHKIHTYKAFFNFLWQMARMGPSTEIPLLLPCVWLLCTKLSTLHLHITLLKRAKGMERRRERKVQRREDSG
ncbi:hypothetical protein KCU71_g136, partial [Aureobasidium melanogenum]